MGHHAYYAIDWVAVGYIALGFAALAFSVGIVQFGKWLVSRPDRTPSAEREAPRLVSEGVRRSDMFDWDRDVSTTVDLLVDENPRLAAVKAARSAAAENSARMAALFSRADLRAQTTLYRGQRSADVIPLRSRNNDTRPAA